jgi:hypothetical protein
MLKALRNGFLAAVVFGGTVALAQLTTSVQMSQDGRGFIISDLTAWHLHIPQSGKGTPALTSCGTSPTITGNDTMGQYTTGSAATTCTLTFATAFANGTRCFVTPQGNLNFPTYTSSTTALTVTVDVASTVYNYLCFGI